MKKTTDETFKITSENYKDYVELYQTKKLEKVANIEYFKGIKYFILTFLILMLILVINNSVALKLLFFADFSFFVNGIVRIIESGNKLNKVEQFKKQYNNINYELSLQEIEKEFEQFYRLRYFLKIEDLKVSKKNIEIKNIQNENIINLEEKEKTKTKVKKG